MDTQNEVLAIANIVNKEFAECPHVSDEDKTRLLGVMKLARSDSTRKSYTENLNKFERDNAIPAHPVTIALWIVNQMDTRLATENRPYKRATIQAWLTAIRLAHLARGYVDPTASPVVTDTVEGLMRKYGTPQNRAKTLTLKEIFQMVNRCESDNKTKDLRDKVLIVLGFIGGFRISELLNLKVANIIPSQYEKFKGYEIVMGKTKTDQRGDKGFKKLIPYGKKISPAALLEEWLEKIGNEGYLIRGVEKNGNIDTKHIEYDAALAVLRYRAQQAKIENWQKVTTHSLRRSFVTQAYKKGHTNQQIAKQTNQAVSTVNRYIEDFDVYENNPALKMW